MEFKNYNISYLNEILHIKDCENEKIKTKIYLTKIRAQWKIVVYM